MLLNNHQKHRQSYIHSAYEDHTINSLPLVKDVFYESYSFFIIPTLILFRKHFPAITMQNGRVHQQLLIEVEQIPISQYCRTDCFTRACLRDQLPPPVRDYRRSARMKQPEVLVGSPARRSSLFRALFQLRHIYCLSCLSLGLLLAQFMGVECSVCRATAVM